MVSLSLVVILIVVVLAVVGVAASGRAQPTSTDAIPQSTLKRVIIGSALLLAGLTGLFMTLCGGLFTFASFNERNIQQSYARAAWVLAVPSLLAGLGLLYFVVKIIRKRSDRLLPPP